MANLTLDHSARLAATTCDRGKRMRNTNALEAIHGGAALTLLGATLAGWTIQDWAAFAALVYSLMLIVGKAYSWIRPTRREPATPPPEE